MRHSWFNVNYQKHVFFFEFIKIYKEANVLIVMGLICRYKIKSNKNSV